MLDGTEFNRALGGGIVPGSLVLLGGDPGIGKSTLLLQVSADIASALGPVLYVSGEESAEQIKLRADRLGFTPERLLVLAETNLDEIIGADGGRRHRRQSSSTRFRRCLWIACHRQPVASPR